MRIFFQRVFRPRWTCIQCTMQTALRMHLDTEATPGYGENDSLLVFVLFAVHFSGHIRHTQFPIFPPAFPCSPSSPELASRRPRPLSGFPFSFFFNYFSLSACAWASKNVQFSRGSSTCRLFLINCTTFWGLPVDAISYWPSGFCRIEPD